MHGSRSVCVRVCLSVCYHKISFLPRFYVANKLYRVLDSIFNIIPIWLSLKMLRSRVLAPFTGHRCLPCSLVSFQQTNERQLWLLNSTQKVYMVGYRSNKITGSSLVEKLFGYLNLLGGGGVLDKMCATGICDRI